MRSIDWKKIDTPYLFCFLRKNKALGLFFQGLFAAEDGIWTHTRKPSLEPESSASAVPPLPLDMGNFITEKGEPQVQICYYDRGKMD